MVGWWKAAETSRAETVTAAGLPSSPSVGVEFSCSAAFTRASSAGVPTITKRPRPLSSPMWAPASNSCCFVAPVTAAMGAPCVVRTSPALRAVVSMAAPMRRASARASAGLMCFSTTAAASTPWEWPMLVTASSSFIPCARSDSRTANCAVRMPGVESEASASECAHAGSSSAHTSGANPCGVEGRSSSSSGARSSSASARYSAMCGRTPVARASRNVGSQA